MGLWGCFKCKFKLERVYEILINYCIFLLWCVVKGNMFKDFILVNSIGLCVCILEKDVLL